jgi:hypothetical protein
MPRELNKNIWPYKVDIPVSWQDDTRLDEIEQWLNSTLGFYREKWYVIYGSNESAYYFKMNTDSTMFALRFI